MGVLWLDDAKVLYLLRGDWLRRPSKTVRLRKDKENKKGKTSDVAQAPKHTSLSLICEKRYINVMYYYYYYSEHSIVSCLR